MKKITLSIVIAASLSAGAAVAGESFKNRGIDYRTTAQSETSVPRDVVSIQANSFNDRGIDYVEAVPVGTNNSRADVSIAVRGFNDRDHIAFTGKRQGVSAERDERVGYAK